MVFLVFFLLVFFVGSGVYYWLNRFVNSSSESDSDKTLISTGLNDLIEIELSASAEVQDHICLTLGFSSGVKRKFIFPPGSFDSLLGMFESFILDTKPGGDRDEADPVQSDETEGE